MGPVGMNVTPAGNLSLGMAQDLRSDEKRSRSRSDEIDPAYVYYRVMSTYIPRIVHGGQA